MEEIKDRRARTHAGCAHTDTELAKRVKWRTDKELPRCKKSSTEAAEANLANERKDNELPK